MMPKANPPIPASSLLRLDNAVLRGSGRSAAEIWTSARSVL